VFSLARVYFNSKIRWKIRHFSGRKSVEKRVGILRSGDPPKTGFRGGGPEMRKNARKCTKMHKNARFSGFPFFLEGRPRPESPPNNTLISNPPRRNSGRVKWKFRPPARIFAPRGTPRAAPREIPRPPDFGPPNLGPRIPCVGAAERNLRFGTLLICSTKKFLAKCFECNRSATTS
jgi:hypothetical protein